MTLVVSNGRFMIADKRLTVTPSMNSFYKPDLSGMTPKRDIDQFRDDGTKLFTPTNVLIKGKRVKAIGFAGDYELVNKLLRLMRHNKRDLDLTELLVHVAYFGVFNISEMSALCIVEGGGTHVVECRGERIIASHNPEGEIVGIGGVNMLRALLSSIVNFGCKEHALLDAFFAGVANATYSGSNYDAYSLDEHVLVQDCRPTSEAVYEGFKRMLAIMGPVHASKSQYNLLAKKD